MTYQPISILEYPFESDDARCPSIGADGIPLIDADEHALWRGRARMEALFHNGKIWKEAWASPEDANVILTDKRLAYSVLKFDKGSTYSGGLIVDTAIMTAVSKTLAAGRRKGKVAAGQLTHRWVRELSIFNRKGVMGRLFLEKSANMNRQKVGALCQADDGTDFSLVLALDPSDAEALAREWAIATAKRRLITVSDLSQENRDLLEAFVASPNFSAGSDARRQKFPRAAQVGFADSEQGRGPT
jgi:hypothetical protein